MVQIGTYGFWRKALECAGLILSQNKNFTCLHLTIKFSTKKRTKAAWQFMFTSCLSLPSQYSASSVLLLAHSAQCSSLTLSVLNAQRSAHLLSSYFSPLTS